ncbi:MAG: phenylacetate-CoA ligase [Limisphaerales bacterium]|jgi:phenylacetate-CoA ligase
MSFIEKALRYYGHFRGYNRLAIANEGDRTLTLKPEEIRSNQLQQFRTHVQRSIEKFPVYARKVEEHLGRLPAKGEELQPADIPVWTKADQRVLFAGLKEKDFWGCFLHSTGGSTGVPTQFYMTRESYEWRLAVTNRGYGYAGAEPGRKAVFIWSDPAAAPPYYKRFKLRVMQNLENRTYFNCFYFSDSRKAKVCKLLDSVRPETIVSYGSKIAELAAYIRNNKGSLRWRAKTVVTGAEGLRPGQRELIEEHICDKVCMSYGSREFMLIGMESPLQVGYHLCEDNLLVEVVDDAGKPVPAGEMGRILVTDLHNTANPFVRYEIGDMGAMSDDKEPCPEGYPFRRLVKVEGRNGEFVYTPNGAKLTAIYFAHHLKEFDWVDAYQVVQKTKDQLHILVLSGREVSEEMKQAAITQMRPKLGDDCQVEIEKVERLHDLANGKTPVIICEVKDDPTAK